MPAGPILLGVIGKPHGVQGHLHVHSYAARPEDLARYGALSDQAGRRFTLRWVARGVAELCELRPEGAVRIADRSAAERLTNTGLFVGRDALPAPAAEEFYLSDLIGMDAVQAQGPALGQVSAVHDYGAGASLEIAAATGPVLVPFTRACVPEIDLAGGRLTVCLPEERIVEAASMQAAS